MTASVKKNFAYKSALSVSSYIFTFFTFPYISRILGVENVGIVNFIDNTVNYFLLFAMMGVNTLGVRAIASSKENQEQRNIAFSNVIGINLIFTVAAFIVYCLCIIYIPRFNLHKDLFLVGGVKFIFSIFVIEWFYTGIENFKYITVRSIIIRILYVIAIFLTIKKKEDYLLYYIITTSVIVLNAIINLLYSHRFVKIKLREVFSFKYFRENITLGVYSIMTSMYLTFNVILLGLITNNVEVGYYTTAFKLYTIILSFFSAFTNVMLPRMSAVMTMHDDSQINQLIKKSFSCIFMFSVPMIVCSIIMAPDIIYVISGPGYEGAILSMQIIMPAILCVGIAQILAVQILIPLKRDNILLKTSVFGAIIGLITNLLFVPVLKSVGSAVVLLVSEFSVTMVYILYSIKTHLVSIPFNELIRSLVLSIPSIVICIISQYYIGNSYCKVAIAVSGSIFIWIIVNYKYNRAFRSLISFKRPL